MRKFFFFLMLIASVSYGQIPAGYYDSAEGLTGTALKSALHEIINDHDAQTYDYLHVAFETTDVKSNGKVWDMYSDIPGGTPPYEYSFTSSDQCGSYGGEGDCYNREHSWPKSWFGGEVSPMYSDLFHLVPTDGYVNGMRSNYPFGEVGSADWTSENGSKLGNCNFPGYSGTVFEPIDDFKGDFARNYLYMTVRYLGEDSGWPGSEMTDGAQLKTWGLNLMKKWDYEDPVSQKEIDRNNAIYDIQNNRNPFIDHPEYVGEIYGYYIGIENPVDQINCDVYSAEGKIIINNVSEKEISVWVFDCMGRAVAMKELSSSERTEIFSEKGIFLVRLGFDGVFSTCKVVV
ncbi:MAG: hypothetical protein A2W91_15890 [Bacteroidetes bacterium GWF2_38_335]|nr:MAG: hypothetical protein A2W91_15890 [Bacteroidetes bacterium GWF2_38_335]OFY81173.1 MAG: hypothetical protein A2281_06865 [Bacteroidetes bacterium RIFOXYA12_FULL_38_20]HBS85286.1 hypothetical protein [Bacteroidales bacterium]